MIAEFIIRYSHRVLTQIKKSKVTKLTDKFLSMEINGEAMFTLVDLSTEEDRKEIDLIIENNSAGKIFADFANARLFGLKNSEYATFDKLFNLNLPEYEQPRIKLVIKHTFETNFYEGFKERILG